MKIVKFIENVQLVVLDEWREVISTNDGDIIYNDKIIEELKAKDFWPNARYASYGDEEYYYEYNYDLNELFQYKKCVNGGHWRIGNNEFIVNDYLNEEKTLYRVLNDTLIWKLNYNGLVGRFTSKKYRIFQGSNNGFFEVIDLDKGEII